jgi:hypothetical protein
MGVSIKGDLRWMIYNGKSYSNHDLGVPLFQETFISIHISFLAYDRSSCSRNTCSCSCKLGRSSVRRLSPVAPAVQQVGPGWVAVDVACKHLACSPWLHPRLLLKHSNVCGFISPFKIDAGPPKSIRILLMGAAQKKKPQHVRIIYAIVFCILI